jgi:hypothetical protein
MHHCAFPVTAVFGQWKQMTEVNIDLCQITDQLGYNNTEGYFGQTIEGYEPNVEYDMDEQGKITHS